MAKKKADKGGQTAPRTYNIMNIFRGNFTLPRQSPATQRAADPIGSPQLISAQRRGEILGKAMSVQPDAAPPSASALMGIARSSVSSVGSSRMDNRKILRLMPEIDKAARYMVATTLSPTDLSRNEIKVVIDMDELSEDVRDALSTRLTEFWERRLNLKASVPSWVYQWGYESGSCAIAVIPLTSFEQIEDSSFTGNESFSLLVKETAKQSLFGFCDKPNRGSSDDFGMESYAADVVESFMAPDAISRVSREDQRYSEKMSRLVNAMVGQEALGISDNPIILSLPEENKKRRKSKIDSVLKANFRPKAVNQQQLVSISAEKPNGEVVGNPISLRLPSESVTPLYTPGTPSDHIGYLVALDEHSNPLDGVSRSENSVGNPVDFSTAQGNMFTEVFNAYGMNGGFHTQSRASQMASIYQSIVTQYVRKKAMSAGFSNFEIGSSDALFRCMFTRFLSRKYTRLLFIPKELMSYMTFEMDENGFGVSRLDRVKFVLGMKMVVMISRVMASIKAAMDRRRVEINFADNLLEPPEQVFQEVITEYLRKSTMAFSIDPYVVQNQIADKSLSIVGNNIPGAQQFSISNDPDQRVSSVDFDPQILEYLDKSAYNGMHIPPSLLNALDENEYSRSVATINLFFSMDINIDQGMVIKQVSGHLRKYATYSEEFYHEVYKAVPSLAPKDVDVSNEVSGEVEDRSGSKDSGLPKDLTVEKIIEHMSITLPKANVAPSETQFDIADKALSFITQAMTALLPDDLAPDESSQKAVAALRANFIRTNVIQLLASSGVNDIEVPTGELDGQLESLNNLFDSLKNVAAMIAEREKNEPAPQDPNDPNAGTSVGGY